jgi:hypothetical protein
MWSACLHSYRPPVPWQTPSSQPLALERRAGLRRTCPKRIQDRRSAMNELRECRMPVWRTITAVPE